MKVKRYVVDNMPEAMQKIRAELGADAVILSSKEIRAGGVLGMFKKKKLEVFAAADAKTAAAPPAPSPQAVSAEVDRILQQVKQAKQTAASAAAAPQASQPSFSSPSVVQAAYQASAGRPRTAGAAVAAERSVSAGRPSAPTADELAKPESLGPPPEPASVPAAALAGSSSDQTSASEIQQVMAELREMKRIVGRLVGEDIPPPDTERDRWKRRLTAQEVDPDVAEEIVREAAEYAAREPADASVPEAARFRSALEAVLLDRLTRHAAEPKGLQSHIRVAHFVGPTGVGKTTSLAKLAAEQVLHRRRKVGFITADTYRIAAVEQLRTYASILNVPMEVVVSPQDLAQAFAKLADRDLILMDTAGRNYRNPMYVSELGSLLRTEGPSETYLVLSMTSKSKDMVAIADTFSAYGIRKLLLTKLDETNSVGSVFNLLSAVPYQLDYVTYGQNVPDDIGLADEAALVRRLLEEPGNG